MDKLPLDKGYAKFGEPNKKWCVEWMRLLFASASDLDAAVFSREDDQGGPDGPPAPGCADPPRHGALWGLVLLDRADVSC